MKKIFLTFISIFLVFLMILSCQSFAAIASTASFSADKTSAKAGEYITCTVNLNITEGNVNGFEGFLTYDKDFFTDVSVNSSYSVNNGQGFSSNSNGLIGIETSEQIKTGTLFTVKLKVNENTTKNNGEIKISSASVFNIDQDSSDLSLSTINVTLDKTQPTVPDTEDLDKVEDLDKPQSNKPDDNKPQENKPDDNKPQENKPEIDKPQSNKPTQKPSGSNPTNSNLATQRLPDAGLNIINIAYVSILLFILIIFIISVLTYKKNK